MVDPKSDRGQLYLTKEFLSKDSQPAQRPAKQIRPFLGKRSIFQPVEDLVHALDSIASSAIAA